MELISRQEAINVVGQMYRYESDRMTALQEIPVIDTTTIVEKAIDEAMKNAANVICVGCGYLDGIKCTYKGSNCGVSKPMLESITEALEQMKNNDLER